MNDDSQITTSADMITRAFSRIEQADIDKNNKILNTWKKIVTGIHDKGNLLAEHSRVIDLKNGILLIETDHPGWIQLFRLNTRYILKGLKMYCPDLHISSLAFRLKGSSASLSGASYDTDIAQEKQKFAESVEKEQEELEKRGFTDSKEEKRPEKQEIPAELKDLFSSLKKTMLTNSGK